MEQLQLFRAILSFASIIFAQGFDYSLSDQEQWPDNFPSCGLKRQSPIALFTNNATQGYFEPLNFFGWGLDFPRQRILKNNGKTAKFTIGPKRLSDALYYTPQITGSILNNTYIYQNIHFHWGKNNSEGSEHSIDGKRYAAEMHIVHRNIRYNSSVAPLHPDGFVVLSALIRPSKNDNPAFDPIVKYLHHVRNYDSILTFGEIYTHRTLLDKINTGRYFTYSGSFTSPPCSEAVTWIVFSDIVKMSNAQLDQFRQLIGKNGQPISGNFRQLQPLNDRTVYIRKAKRDY